MNRNSDLRSLIALGVTCDEVAVYLERNRFYKNVCSVCREVRRMRCKNAEKATLIGVLKCGLLGKPNETVGFVCLGFNKD